jgi:hypothetical protein
VLDSASSGRTSNKLAIRPFAQHLIETGDLDPVYVALHGARLPEDQLCRWLLAYMYFYHVGAASRLSERSGVSFWIACLTAARNERQSPVGGRWPRSSERRHFRGEKCVNAVESMQRSEPEPEGWVRALKTCATEEDVMRRVKLWPMFGNWAGFKLADLLERCAGYEIAFNPQIGLLYDSPRQGLEDMTRHEPGRSLEEHYGEMLEWIGQFPAPPGNERSCGPAELETVLCKFHSYLGGHYHCGKDTAEVRHALAGWGETAERLLKAAPAPVFTS